jgi:hypothetical protein
MNNKSDDEERDYTPYADMECAVEIARLVRDTRRRPPRNRCVVALAMIIYAADICRDDADAARVLRARLLEVAADLEEHVN